jgi:hypothetical protein
MGLFSRRAPAPEKKKLPTFTTTEVTQLIILATMVNPKTITDDKALAAYYKAKSMVTETPTSDDGVYLYVEGFTIRNG